MDPHLLDYQSRAFGPPKTHLHRKTCEHKHMRVRMRLCIYIYIYIYIYLYACAHIYIYIYISLTPPNHILGDELKALLVEQD